MTDAVVYIPDDLECEDGLFARRGVVHIERRGHRFSGVLRKWEQVLIEAAKGAVVVFAKQEHATRHSRYPGIKREFVGEETCRLVPIIQGSATRRRTFDEAPTVALLDRWRAGRGHSNGRIPAPEFPRGDDGGFAENFLKSRRNARDT